MRYELNRIRARRPLQHFAGAGVDLAAIRACAGLACAPPSGFRPPRRADLRVRCRARPESPCGTGRRYSLCNCRPESSDRMSPAPHTWSEGARLRLVPAVMRQYSNVRPRFTSSRRSASTSSAFVAPGPCEAITASMESTTSSEAMRNKSSSSRVLRARRRSSGKCASTNVTPGSSRAMSSAASAGRNARSIPTRFTPAQAFEDDRTRLRGIEARSRGLESRGPELPEVLLIRFHSVTDISRLVRAAFDVDEERQIAADADRVEMIEEEEPVAADEILDVVLGARSPLRRCRPRRGARQVARCQMAAMWLSASRRQCGRAFFHDFLPPLLSAQIEGAASL